MRYQIRPERVLYGDRVRRIRYRAYFGNCTIGELAPSFRCETVMIELQELINDGGIGTMADLPAPQEVAL